MPASELIPFLKSPDPRHHETAMTVVGELGDKAAPLLPFAKPHLKSHDAWTRANAIDCILVCGTSGEFALILEMLLHPNQGTRKVAFEYALRAERATLLAARDCLSPPKRRRSELHIQGLSFVTRNPPPNAAEIEAMQDSPEELLRIYGDLAATREERRNCQQ